MLLLFICCLVYEFLQKASIPKSLGVERLSLVFPKPARAGQSLQTVCL